MALTTRDTALVTAQQAVVYLPGRVTADDALIESLVTQASGQISDLCGRLFAYGAREDYYDGDGTDTLWLDNWPVSGTVSIWSDANGVFDATSLLTERSAGSGDYVVYGQERDIGKVRRVSGLWPYGVRNIKATYTSGYTDQNIPAPIQLATCKLIAYYYGRTKLGLNSTTSQTVSKGGTLTLSDAIMAELEPILRPFRRPRLVA